MRSIRNRFLCAAASAAALALVTSAVPTVLAFAPSGEARQPQQAAARTSPFQGVKANTGYATAAVAGGKITLSVSDDFVIPETPAPHWQVIDGQGNVYLLNQFRIKGEKTNRTIVLPAYVKDVAKVQVWCSFAEALLGEASFAEPVKK